ncbi:MAG: hypothetical protein R2762_02650 [Bryobacteraceae bacterium]
MKTFKLRRGRTELDIADVKVNGRPLVTVHELAVLGGGGTLTFAVGITPDQRTIIGGFKSVAGMDSETELVEYNGPAVGVSRPMTGWTLVSELPARQAMPGMPKFSNVTLKRG